MDQPGRIDDRRVVKANLDRVDHLARDRKLLSEYAAWGKDDGGEDGLYSLHALLHLGLYLPDGGLCFIRGTLLLLRFFYRENLRLLERGVFGCQLDSLRLFLGFRPGDKGSGLRQI